MDDIQLWLFWANNGVDLFISAEEVGDDVTTVMGRLFFFQHHHFPDVRRVVIKSTVDNAAIVYVP